MATFAGVAPNGVRQGGHLLKGLEHRSTQEAAAGDAVGRATTEGIQFGRFAEGTDKVMRSGDPECCFPAHWPVQLY